MNELTTFKNYATGERLMIDELDKFVQFGNHVVYDDIDSVIEYAQMHLKDELIELFIDNLGCENWTRSELYKEIKDIWGCCLGNV